MGDVRAKLLNRFGAEVRWNGSGVEISDASALESEATDELVWAAVFGEPAERSAARSLLWDIGQAIGARPASIHDLYMARGEGKVSGFTVPAINVRMMAFDTARAVFRAARQRDVGALILEIARSEIAYTDQRPAEYVSVMIGAALREGFHRPLFIQGDHSQVNAKKYAADPEGEVGEVRKLIGEEIAAGFYNIDVDTSTLVDLSRATLDEQQRDNYVRAAELTVAIRGWQPEGVNVSVGAEIGEVGHKNSTVAELRAFMEGFNRSLAELGGGGLEGISKISVQTGTSHGGVVLSDGSIADVKLDLDTLRDLSKVAREEYRLAGAVQHGASTLPDDAFGNFPRVEACEIHLATNFQNMIYDHPAMPAELRDRMYAWCRENVAGERKDDDTDEQFYYKTRKKAIGPFKQEVWSLPAEIRRQIGESLEEKFGFLFDQLKVGDTARIVSEHVAAPAMPHAELAEVSGTAEDDPDAGE